MEPTTNRPRPTTRPIYQPPLSNPVPTLTPTPTPTRVPKPTCNELSTRGVSRNDDNIGINPNTIVRVDNVGPIMRPGECVNASVYTGILLPSREYSIGLRAEYGVGFHTGCAITNSGFVNLVDQRSYRFSFPVVACENLDGRGTITATVSKDGGGVVATETIDVVLPPLPYPARYPAAIGPENNKCIVSSGVSDEAGKRTADGLAHYGSAKILSGYPETEYWGFMLGGVPPANLCFIGMVESVSSRYTGEAMTVTTTLRKTGQTPRTSTVTGSCSTLDNHRYPCRRITPFLYVSVPSVYNFLFGVPSDRLYLSGTHEISSGLDTITLDTSSRYNVPVED